jgi:membrane protein YdbS with pleckstrin-like domain
VSIEKHPWSTGLLFGVAVAVLSNILGWPWWTFIPAVLVGAVVVGVVIGVATYRREQAR